MLLTFNGSTSNTSLFLRYSTLVTCARFWSRTISIAGRCSVVDTIERKSSQGRDRGTCLSSCFSVVLALLCMRYDGYAYANYTCTRQLKNTHVKTKIFIGLSWCAVAGSAANPSGACNKKEHLSAQVVPYKYNYCILSLLVRTFPRTANITIALQQNLHHLWQCDRPFLIAVRASHLCSRFCCQILYFKGLDRQNKCAH